MLLYHIFCYKTRYVRRRKPTIKIVISHHLTYSILAPIPIRTSYLISARSAVQCGTPDVQIELNNKIIIMGDDACFSFIWTIMSMIEKALHSEGTWATRIMRKRFISPVPLIVCYSSKYCKNCRRQYFHLQ